MIQITTQHRLFIHINPIDFRKGIDALIGLCRSKCQQDPCSGTIFVFRNHTGNTVKLLSYDGTGFWLMQKRFSQGKLRYWPTNTKEPVCATTLMVILHQGQPGSMQSSWKHLPSSAL